eukprot:CAMPEP_0178976494 /NCGR_PEP_ID=MMETSP0789-20121207/23871_1 /TAXON_ID=3005 /ORGANISM="Rhizosolenia setigera, Strain CCMP 1694" /LENGTH=212 /DNA_ID=CAMNT_0020665601 /DNA_START=69 /DNA_END=707 /DNA_ORIENTATION=+
MKEDDEDDDELKSDGSSSCASTKKKGRWIRKLFLRKKINLVHFIRFMTLICFLSLFTLPLLIIAFASSTSSSSSYLNLVQPLEYTVDPFLINCKFMNKMVLLSEEEEQQNFNFICEETCVPYAGIKRVSNSGGMSLGTCNDVGYTCFQYYYTKTKRTQQDGNNTTTTWNEKNTMIKWMTGLEWNTEYQPSIGVYTNHSTMYCNTTTTTTTMY